MPGESDGARVKAGEELGLVGAASDDDPEDGNARHDVVALPQQLGKRPLLPDAAHRRCLVAIPLHGHGSNHGCVSQQRRGSSTSTAGKGIDCMHAVVLRVCRSSSTDLHSDSDLSAPRSDRQPRGNAAGAALPHRTWVLRLLGILGGVPIFSVCRTWPVRRYTEKAGTARGMPRQQERGAWHRTTSRRSLAKGSSEITPERRARRNCPDTGPAATARAAPP